MDVRPPSHGMVYRIAQYGSRTVFTLFHHYSLVGRENVPTGPAVYLVNHESYFDPLMITNIRPTPIYFAAKEELFEVWHGWLFPRLNCIPVKRGVADIRLFRTTQHLLTTGRQLCMFPEGTRSHDGRLGEAQPGSIAIPLRAGVPIVPIGIAGTHAVLPSGGGWRSGPIGLEIGKPMSFPALYGRRASKTDVVRIGAIVMDQIARLRARVAARIGVELPEPLPPNESMPNA